MDEQTKSELKEMHRQGSELRERMTMMRTKMKGHERESTLANAEARLAEIVAELGRLLDAVGL